MSNITFVHTADLHLSSSYPNCHTEEDISFRTEDVFRNFKAIVDYVIEKDPTLFFISGDIFNSANVKKEIVLRFISELERILKNTSTVKIFIVTGQHDLANDGTTALTLVKETYNKLNSGDYRIFIADDWSYFINFPENKLMVTSVPFSNKVGEELIKTNEFAKNKELVKDNFKFLITHLPFSGSLVGNHKLENQNNTSIVDGFDYVAAGDIHQFQILSKNIYYPGSIIKLNFGERKDSKGFIYGEVDDDKNLKTEFISLKDREYLVLSVRDKTELKRIMESDLREKVKGNVIKIKFWVGGELTLEDEIGLEQKMADKDGAKSIVSEIKYMNKDNTIGAESEIGFGLSFDDALESLFKESEIPKGVKSEDIRKFVRRVRSNV